MSVIFGRWNFEDVPPDTAYLDRIRSILALYAPDDSHTHSGSGVDILYHSFHTTKESRSESQPLVTTSGVVVAWDGRLDNRDDMIHQLQQPVPHECGDVAIVAAAYQQWNTGCFAKLVGDWALSIWDPTRQSLILAKDPIGPRQLYYRLGNDQLFWSTVLDALVLCSTTTFVLDEEYVAGWLSFFPATHLTPYVGIHAVSPASYVRFEKRRQTVTEYWGFDPSKRIRYKSDSEYEDHFRAMFTQSVRRRLRSDTPILAELSGGMDSSSIVCVADRLIAIGEADLPTLDTISYYDQSEPGWNEYPYFIKVEEKRGRSGHHIDVSPRNASLFGPHSDRFVPTPASSGNQNSASASFAACLLKQGNRVVLSGIGGDEVTGGIPTPSPELADLLATLRVGALAHQLKVWALNKRRPWFHLLFDAARGFFPSAFVGLAEHTRPAPWLRPTFIRNHRAVLAGYRQRIKFIGPLPTFQENVIALQFLQRQLGCSPLPTTPHYEKRYPFLDRDLLEFLYAVPREQLVRPGQRRSLMRRALVGIIPSEILNRRRKAYVARGPSAGVAAEWANAIALTHDMTIGALGIVQPEAFAEALCELRNGREIPIIPVFRTLSTEMWLRNAIQSGHLRISKHRPGPMKCPSIDALR
jgi:asparagine synthase (glutamine-hydrolysing)